MNDVINLLWPIPGVHVTTRPIELYSPIIVVDWSMESGQNEDNYGMANALSSDGLIYTIILAIDGDSYLSLGDFTEIYGQPDLLQAYQCDGTLCLFRLVYLHIGTMLELQLPGRGYFLDKHTNRELTTRLT